MSKQVQISNTRRSNFSESSLQEATEVRSVTEHRGQKGKKGTSFRAFMLHAVHDDGLYAEIENARALLDKGGLVLSQDNNAVVSPFIEMFQADLSRVTVYIKSEQESQELSAKAFLSNIDTIVSKSGGDISKTLRLQAEDLVKANVGLERFITRNQAVLQDIATYANEVLGTSCVTKLQRLLQRRFTMVPWKGPNSALVVVLSDIYEVIRAAEQPSQQADDQEQWEAPSSFERSTTKYWVEDDKLTDLLLTSVREVPLLVYGRSGRLTTKAECKHSEGDKLWDSLATPISSVYFDSPNMTMYKERIARHEGAQLFRVRWYGSKPKQDELVFLELKTHHEKWINTKSVKERVNVREKDMAKFLARAEWTLQDAEPIVLAASPKLTGEALNKATNLLLTMHQLVLEQDLRPCVRSVYVRAAFQFPKNNDIRLTIDRNITLIDETSTPEGEWCIPDDAIVEASMVSRAPYPVFEVKLAGSEMPEAIHQLVDDGVIREVAKFSKFLTGAAAFNADKIETLPYWAEYPIFAEMFSMPVKGIRTDDSASKQVLPRRSNSAIARKPEPESRRIEGTSKKECISSSADLLLGTKDKRFNQNQRTVSFGWPRSEPKRRIAPKKPARVEPKSYFANERTFIQWISAALLLITISAILIEKGDDDGILAATGMALTIGAGFVVVYATFVYFRRLRLLSKGASYGYVDHLGPVVLAAAVLSGVLVLLFYLTSPSSSGNSGSMPLLRAESGLCYQHSNKGIPALLYQPSDLVIDNDRDMLLVPSLQRIVGHFREEPNSNAVTLVEIPDADLEGLTYAGDRLFALSEMGGRNTSSLIELEWRSVNERLQVVQRWDLEGFTQGGEGITYVPDDKGPEGLYIEGGGSIGVYDVPPRVGDSVADGTPTLRRRESLNNNILKNGLEDGKIAGQYYFEGVLYILHDNDRKVRGWDVETASLLSEFTLPNVGASSNKQWEGFAVERNTGNQRLGTGNQRLGSGLKGGGSSTSLIVHLALDSPPQVWSFAVEEGDSRGSLIMPACAGAQ
jgi:SPX domain protein involved in polyphosphate accumulation/uncharacterized membrane protein YidH (DUF202 family)